MRIASFSASCESGGATRNRGYIESFVATPSRKAKESLPQDDKRSGWGFTGLKAGAFTGMHAVGGGARATQFFSILTPKR